MQEMVTIISTVGFPIFACCVMFKENQKFSDTLNQELDKLVEALNTNKVQLQELTDHIEELIRGGRSE